MEMETESGMPSVWGNIVEWKGVQSHVESAGWSVSEVCQNECPLTIVPQLNKQLVLYIYYYIWKNIIFTNLKGKL